MPGQTNNYGLTKYLPGDFPRYLVANEIANPGELGTYNGDMYKIDSALKVISDRVDTAETNITNLQTGKADASAVTATGIGATFNNATAKTTPVDADSVGLVDSAAANVIKKLTWANLKNNAVNSTTLGTVINNSTLKDTPVDTDTFGYSDSAASNQMKKMTWTNLKARLKEYFDTFYTITTTNIGTVFNGATTKTTPVDADLIGIADSTSSFIIRKTTWANIKTTLKAYFDTIYATPAQISDSRIQTTDTTTLGPTILSYNNWVTVGNISVTRPYAYSTGIIIGTIFADPNVAGDMEFRITDDWLYGGAVLSYPADKTLTSAAGGLTNTSPIIATIAPAGIGLYNIPVQARLLTNTSPYQVEAYMTFTVIWGQT